MAISKELREAIQSAARTIIAQNSYGGAVFPEKNGNPEVRIITDHTEPRSKIAIAVGIGLDNPFCSEIKKYCDELDERSEAEVDLNFPTVTVIKIIPNREKKHFPWLPS